MNYARGKLTMDCMCDCLELLCRAAEATFSSKKTTSSDESKENAAGFQAAAQETEEGQRQPEAAMESASLAIASADDTAHLDLPSRSIVLKHIWDPLEGSDAAFFRELEDDMRSECGKHGAVEHVQIVDDGSVVVRFAELTAAIACLKVMNGRWFAGRQIEAQFDQSTTEEPSDADTKMEAFLASLGD
ncbi:unnamed protein product [Phytophthora lilii]|uniref:Unnamed protein product n=1 Tax=Phytophthora lilii TaxID=2077276 RepID=A0A9W6U8A5_9STRA|nr:unnamed protein product [Phytophthora lilii]